MDKLTFYFGALIEIQCVGVKVLSKTLLKQSTEPQKLYLGTGLE